MALTYGIMNKTDVPCKAVLSAGPTELGGAPTGGGAGGAGTTTASLQKCCGVQHLGVEKHGRCEPQQRYWPCTS